MSRVWLYLVGGKDGSVKVGISCRPDGRIRAHRRALTENFAWTHLFAGTPGRMACTVEVSVKKRFAQIGARVGRTEVFFGIPKATAIAEARVLISARRVEHDKWVTARDEMARREAAWAVFYKRWVEDQGVKAKA